MEERFYFCNSCGNLMIAAIASGVMPFCCGEEMTLLKPNTSDGNQEKHVPDVSYVSKHAIKVKVGSMVHPMEPKHNIRFICLETSVGCVVRYLHEDETPEVTIRFDGKPIAVYAYCNIHGLWRADVPECEEDCKPSGCRVM